MSNRQIWGDEPGTKVMAAQSWSPGSPAAGQPLPRLTTQRKRKFRPVHFTSIAALLVLVALGAFIGVRHFRNSSSNTTATSAVAISASGLKTLANGLGHPIYWAGPQSGTTYELTQAADGRIYIRYLPAGVVLGSRHPYLTVATYPLLNAYAATTDIAGRASSVKVAAKGGAVAFYGKALPNNVYMAFPGANYQVEIYSPTASEAKRIVQSGLITSPGGGNGTASTATAPKSGAVAASASDLKSASVKLGKTIYWLGAQHGMTYELTEASDGRVYVRYLPAGVATGVDKPYLTVGSYPVKSAFKTTSSAASQPGAVKIPISGGVAFYTKTNPKSVYVALKGTNEQIEVFDPNAAAAHSLVAAGKVSAAG